MGATGKIGIVVLGVVLGGMGRAAEVTSPPPASPLPSVNSVPKKNTPSPPSAGTVDRPGEAASRAPVPLPVSVEVKRDHTIVKQRPTTKVRRRGVVMKGARFSVFERMNGFGCTGSWYRVCDEGWICSTDVIEKTEPPHAEQLPRVPSGQIIPWPYGFVREPTLEYRVEGNRLVEVRELQQGFGFGIASLFRVNGTKFFRTAENTLIHRDAAGMTDRISTFEGMIVRGRKPWPIGFVTRRHAAVYREPAVKKALRIGEAERYTPFEILETSGKGWRGFVRFDEGAWLRRRDVRITREAPLPKGIPPGEHWIDVDTSEQIMTAYEGEAPVYTTLISSGRQGSRTVKGVYRIWVKVAAIAMDNTDEELEAPPVETATTDTAGTDTDTDAGGTGTDTSPPPEERHLYSLHDVPWTQFFHESFAIHGVYWHDGFGNAKSHGCVNLSPKDARWFYNWTRPKVPPGFWAVHSTETDPGTLIRVR